ncbi:hypothetical protein HJC23_003372 [Cyclotella cryptica]|uniref:Tyrosine specific protein phosphatases domain-containing protein n=1 Tax=Cyclotella cryptica TaxID=29204 RepID=A0ABD3QY57_9STRA|eukprot:CCRYP_000951-RA/>CCRYP_000951-RA protein AED:0.09 eAED:0.09 QI:0/-1/0/1/-1/1/1/0/323
MILFSFLIRSTAFFSQITQSRGAFQSFSNTRTTKLADAHSPPTISSLLDRAQTVRRKLYGNNDSLPTFLHDTTQLAYPSSTYLMKPDDSRQRHTHSVMRGFCNWLLPKRIMIGQYPGMTPESNGPSLDECHRHIETMVRDARISLFCCLQTEVPSQWDNAGWDRDKVYLEPMSLRKEFPRPFTRYGTMTRELADHRRMDFIHNPIEDLGVPTCNNSLLRLLSGLIQHLEENEARDDCNNAIYIHCWGGRGRAGLVGSCLVSLLFPELESSDVLEFVQEAYSTRLGAADMPYGLRRSPQTDQQRSFVKEFVRLVHNEREQSTKT